MIFVYKKLYQSLLRFSVGRLWEIVVTVQLIFQCLMFRAKNKSSSPGKLARPDLLLTDNRDMVSCVVHLCHFLVIVGWYPWNFLSTKFPVYEMSCLWNDPTPLHSSKFLCSSMILLIPPLVFYISLWFTSHFPLFLTYPLIFFHIPLWFSSYPSFDFLHSLLWFSLHFPLILMLPFGSLPFPIWFPRSPLWFVSYFLLLLINLPFNSLHTPLCFLSYFPFMLLYSPLIFILLHFAS